MNVRRVTVQIPGSEEIYDIVSKEGEAIHPDGWMMSNVERLLKAGAWFGTTGGSISLLLVLAGLLASFMAGIKFDRSKIDRISFGGRTFEIVGMAQIPNERNVLMPVYRDIVLQRQLELQQERGGR